MGYSPRVCKESDMTEQEHGMAFILGAFLMTEMVKNLLAVQVTRVPSLGQEDPLEEEMTTHSSILTWRIPWTKEPGGLQFMGSQKVRQRMSD